MSYRDLVDLATNGDRQVSPAMTTVLLPVSSGPEDIAKYYRIDAEPSDFEGLWEHASYVLSGLTWDYDHWLLCANPLYITNSKNIPERWEKVLRVLRSYYDAKGLLKEALGDEPYCPPEGGHYANRVRRQVNA